MYALSGEIIIIMGVIYLEVLHVLSIALRSVSIPNHTIIIAFEHCWWAGVHHIR